MARGLIYRFISAAYRHPEPGETNATTQQNEAVSQAVAVLDEFSDRRLAERCGDLLGAAKRNTPAALQNDYVSLFSHVIQGRCASEESTVAA